MSFWDQRDRKKAKKFQIEVRENGKTVGTINRVLTAESMGNWNPIFARYNKKAYLVHSDEGDLSDPFRRDETYLTTLYIKSKKFKE